MPAAVVLLAALIGILPHFIKHAPPLFALVKPITRPDSGIAIVAQNDAADRRKALDLELDGYVFLGAGKPIPKSDPPRWHAAVLELDLPDSLLRGGAHRVRVRFAGEEFSEHLTLGFNTKPPVVSVEATQPEGKPQDRIFSGKVASKLQAEAETLAVDIAFHHEGKPVEISLPVKRLPVDFRSSTRVAFRLRPKVPPRSRLLNGETALVLK